jgi:hypothetical protein
MPTRRSFVTRLAAVALARPVAAAGAPAGSERLDARIIDSVAPRSADDLSAGPRGPLRIGEFNMVGQYDVDWLTEPPLARLLDYMAASPSAFARFGSFTRSTAARAPTRSMTIRSTAVRFGPTSMRQWISRAHFAHWRP